jgi:hypothetical protein
MPKSHKQSPDNTALVDAELDLSAARLWQYLNINKSATIKNLQDNYAEIITEKLKGLLPSESIARIGIRLTLGRLQRQGKIKVFHDVYTNQDKVCLAGDWLFKSKWMSALEISPNML